MPGRLLPAGEQCLYPSQQRSQLDWTNVVVPAGVGLSSLNWVTAGLTEQSSDRRVPAVATAMAPRPLRHNIDDIIFEAALVSG